MEKKSINGIILIIVGVLILSLSVAILYLTPSTNVSQKISYDATFAVREITDNKRY